MRKFILTIITLTLISGCKNKPIIIDLNLLKYDWVSEDGYNRLYIENDSLMFQTLASSEDPVSSYKIHYDTLYIFAKDIINPQEWIWKLGIIKVDSFELVLKHVLPPLSGLWEPIVFKKQTYTKKNDLKFERIEFYSRSGSGGVVADQSFIIGSDSILYHYGYDGFNRSPTQRKGLSKYKLSPIEFSKIQDKLNYIDFSNIENNDGAPGAGYQYLFIKTLNDSIEIRGSFGMNNQDFGNFMRHLAFLERFVNLKPIEDKEVSFRYNYLR